MEETSAEEAASSSEGDPGCDDLDPVLEVFLEMLPRKVRRIQNSRVPQQSLMSTVTLALQILIVFVLIANLFDLSIKRIGLQGYKIIPISMTVALVVPTMVQTWFTPEHTFSAWVSTEVHVFCMWMAWEFQDLSRREDSLSEEQVCIEGMNICIQKELITIAITFASLLGTTVVLYLFKWAILSCTIRFRCFRRCVTTYWFLPRQERSRPGLTKFSYKPGGWMGVTACEFSYHGATDEHGRPHGSGVWSDTSFHGENLRGLWVHGRPAGCFTSRESGTGAQFLQRAVGYVTSRGDCKPGNIAKSSVLPFKAADLRFGQGLVEASFAGGFFPFLPSVEHHQTEVSLAALVQTLGSSAVEIERGPHGSLSRRQDRWGTLKLEVVDQEDLTAWQRRTGFDSLLSGLRSTQLNVQYLDGTQVGYVTSQDLVQAGGLAYQAKDEALVFIHGYNCDLGTALGRIAQTLALGNMNGHIVPFVFSYSSGQVLQYFSAKSHMRQYGADLSSFLRDLSSHFEEVHILTHSCGAEFFFANWEAIEDCFQPSRRQSLTTMSRSNGSERWIPQGRRTTNGDARLHLATLTLMNPDVLVARVLEKLPKMMQVVEHFTSYNDANDGALFWSGWLQTVVPRWYQERRWDEATAVFGRQLKPFWVERGENGIFLRGELVDCCAPVPRGASVGSVATWPSGPSAPGDGSIDIINCSTIDQNVHKLRHNYYMLNTQMVEDVCELIGARLRASYRQRLCQVDANIFNFLSPPGHLKD